MNPDDALSPELPIYVLIPLVLLGLFLLRQQAKKSRDDAASFVIAALGLRVLLDALHQFTFTSSPLGLTYNALASLLICGVGLLVIKRNAGLGMVLPPITFLLVSVVISVYVSHPPGFGSQTIIKLFYFTVIVILTAQACKRIGADRFLHALLPLALLPLVFQIISIVLGVAKAGESDGSASYIGGFHHEAAFSLLLAIACLVVCLTPRLRYSIRVSLIITCLVGLLLANYRTTILGILPVIAVALFAASVKVFMREQRKLVGLGAVFIIAFLGLALATTDQERFADIGSIVSQGTDLIGRPGTVSPDQERLLSGRVGIWNGYIYAWRDGRPEQQAFGFGPDVWQTHFVLYAHNTLVSVLYELGIMGTFAYLALWAWFLGLSLLAPNQVRLNIIAGHLGFFILNMATMPMWMIEGLFYYALLCGVTVFYVGQRNSLGVSAKKYGPRGGNGPALI